MTKVKVKPEEWYTMQDLVKGGVFPLAKSLWSVRNVVAIDRRKENLLKVTIVGTGRGTKYHFKGENIIKFLKAVEAGTVSL